jgi:hypothetical protein
MSEQEKLQFMSAGRLISITQAAKYTPYSAAYLSLLARKQKLPAMKINRDWLTTREAVLGYVKQQQKRHEKILRDFAEAESNVPAQVN